MNHVGEGVGVCVTLSGNSPLLRTAADVAPELTSSMHDSQYDPS